MGVKTDESEKQPIQVAHDKPEVATAVLSVEKPAEKSSPTKESATTKDSDDAMQDDDMDDVDDFDSDSEMSFFGGRMSQQFQIDPELMKAKKKKGIKPIHIAMIVFIIILIGAIVAVAVR